ncbi:hypothetical protein KCP91_15410 [Microvirga sp. SRT01]|jgi:hypothetical protein|uniref:Uncharacterized protein n=1 Tax=Sphingomonas longa TaxID=2778730 RepID=A0ABS2DA16_9SPHN|nr:MULTISPECIES: hypothetical protein [Alphaproteobacteria]MBM6577770.1 hypothetical protein [Sphingomonas sp. BT552]MBR7710812.1 hypothetical protein [Microvirga sp. SRT01]
MFGWFKKPKQELTDAEMGSTLKALVVGVLSQHGGLDPNYRPDVLSEEDFEARSAELPLIVVWGEHDTPEGLAFSMSVNKHLVEKTVLGFVAREDQWFLPARNQIVEDLRTATFAAMMKAVEATGAPPSAVCRSMSSG